MGWVCYAIHTTRYGFGYTVDCPEIPSANMRGFGAFFYVLY